MRTIVAIVWLVWLGVLGACSGAAAPEEVLHEFPVTDLAEVLTRSGVGFDPSVTSDGNGSLRLEATQATTFRLYEVTGVDVEDARLIYRARLRTQGVEGKVYLELWCRFPGAGEFFSRALHAPLTGTTEWTHQETPFFLDAGQNPDLLKLNVVVEGTGTVWVDEIVLAKGPR